LSDVSALLQASAPAAPPPRPTHDQTVAGYRRLQETRALMRKILDDPRAGRQNIRPLLLDAAAALVGDRLATLAEVMSGLKDFPGPDDPGGPLKQKQWVRRVYETSTVAQQKLLQDHRMASVPDGQPGAPWSVDDHSLHMAGLMAHYPGR
jgi:hypothetical protein